MVGFETWTEVHARARRGEAKQKIARELALDRKTVRRILRQERPRPYTRMVKSASVVDPYRAVIHRRVVEVDYNAARIFHELQMQGYRGGYERVKLVVRPLRAERDQMREATVRFETPPGQQAQVDWGTVTVPIAGQPRRVHMFAMVLGYSRCQYFEFTEAENLAALLLCHQHAFDWFGGVPEEIVYDNQKAVVLRRDCAGQTITWNPRFWDFARYYGVTPRLCQPGRAQTKGKVEAGIKYGKRAFVLGGTFASLDDMNAQAHHWIRTVSDQRLHGTTFQRPAERFLKERLRSHRERPPYPLQQSLVRKVATDCLVSVETNRYSVPPTFVGRLVEVQWRANAPVQIYHQGALIASHPAATGPHQVCVDPAHYRTLRQRVTMKPVPRGPSQGLALASWAGPFPDVAVRPLAWYEALLGDGGASPEYLSPTVALGRAIAMGSDPWPSPAQEVSHD